MLKIKVLSSHLKVFRARNKTRAAPLRFPVSLNAAALLSDLPAAKQTPHLPVSQGLSGNVGVIPQIPHLALHIDGVSKLGEGSYLHLVEIVFVEQKSG